MACSDKGRPAEAITPFEAARKFSIVLFYIVVSGCLIRFNKFLMHPDHFPYSMFLAACHMFMSFVCASLLYLVKPSFFPGAMNSKGDMLLVVKWMMPIGITFAVALYCSNKAYTYCSVSFLQFMKEGNVILGFLLSCAVGLQCLNRVRMAIILWIICGSAMAVRGELHFVLVGFLFQLVSQVAECSRTVMGELVLGGGGLKLDPLSYTLFVAPTCLVVLLLGNFLVWDASVLVALANWWPYVLPNACLAFVLNVVVATVIKETSAVGFLLAGVCKDICIVLFSCIFFGEEVTPVQTTGFIVALAGVFFWSYLQAVPEGSAAQLLGAMLRMPAERMEANEQTFLAPQKV